MSYVDHTGSGQSTSAQSNLRQSRSRRNRRQQAQLALSRAVTPVLHLEGLEQRTMLSTLPAPIITTHSDISGGGDNVNRSAPSIAYDPNNPDKLVTVYTSEETDVSGVQKVFVRGLFSQNGGLTWEAFGINSNIINPYASPIGETPNPYSQASDATVGFDLDDQFYIAYSEHTGNYDSGAIMLQKYDFSQDAPIPDAVVQDVVLYQWAEHDFAYTPMLAVDTNQESFADPDTAALQEDPFSGNIYVAWGTDNKAPTGASNFNPNTVRMVASSDGGFSWGPGVLVDGNNSGTDRNGYPKLVVSQGSADGRVIGGQVTVVYDDFNSGHSSSPQIDFIKAGRIEDGASVIEVRDDGIHAIIDAVLPQGSGTSVPTPDPADPADLRNKFLLPISIADPNFVSLSDLDVFLSISSENLSDLSITLSDPSGLKTVTLVRNKTTTAGNQQNGVGITGADLGVVNARNVSAVFDDDAARRINDNNAQSNLTAHFRPELGTMSVFAGMTPAQINGAWTLTVTDNHNSSTSTLLGWGIQLRSGSTVAGTSNAATTRVTGANPSSTFPLKTTAMPDRGVGPGAVVASDNTLGAFSPYQGRIYVGYVDKVVGGGNPADNTDIYLSYSDDGGASWISFPKINDDEAELDGFSSTFGTSRGRPQFMPSIAVDQTTGTLVMMWFDGRNDPDRAQVAQYITTSLDGGTTFSKQTFVNQPNTVTDAITGEVKIRGPIPDNQSNSNPNKETDFGFGFSQGLVAAHGQVHPVWSGNLNGGLHGNTLLHIHTAGITIAAGPRIVDSTQAAVSTSGDIINPPTVGGTPQFSKIRVVFDRPIDPSTFTKDAVQVFFRSPTTLGTAAGTPVSVATVTALDNQTWGPADALGATTFDVVLTTPQTKVGTYSYFITPNLIRDRIRSLNVSIAPQPPVTINATAAQINLNIPSGYPASTGGTGTAEDFTTSTIDVSTIPAGQVVSSMTVKVSITHTWDSDLVLTLVAPNGQEIILADGVGEDDDNFTNTIFDDNALIDISSGTAPFTGSFRPEELLGQLRGIDPNGQWTLKIEDVADGDHGTLLAWSMTITPGVTGPGAGNRIDQNQNGTAGEAAIAGAFVGDVYAIPRPTSNGSFNGTFFLPPFSTDTLPVIVPGPRVISSNVNGNPVTLDNLVLNKTANSIDITFDRAMDPTTVTPAAIVRMVGPIGAIAGPFIITANPLGNDPSPANPKTYRIGFPTQTLSGTYSITLSAAIKSKDGDTLDMSLNAGVDALRGISTVTTPVTSNATGLPGTISNKVLESTLTITDPFLIQFATLTLNITYPNDPDLTATLVAPDGTEIILFDKVGNVVGSKANFQNTVFDDTASTPIQNGAAPFFGKFNPQLPLSVLKNKLSAGKWTLRISSTGISTGTLNSWSLTLNKPVPGTGLGEAAADQPTVSFRIFTMDPANPQSHNTWTPVGGASENNAANSGRIGGIAIDPSDPSGNTVYVAGSAGGIWKTRNFLTTNAIGPTWVPLTDLGPTYSLNIGSIALFPRNNDPNQTIVFAATGYGDGDNGGATFNSTITRGVGFLRSMDGGATWTLLDSTNNVDASGNPLAINSPSRDHIFVNTSAFKVLVDPKPTPSGDTIVYAALSGSNGGIWRSLDTGKHWTKMRAGQATDIVFDLNSGFFDALNNPTGNLQFLYAAFDNEGVYFSPNRGTVWNQLLGTTGTPLIRDHTDGRNTAVTVQNTTSTPNGNKGRITLAKPALTGNALNDTQYQGWLYALVAGSSGGLDGLYGTKDFGQTWTKIRIPRTASGDGEQPSNDLSLPDDPIFGGQGNYDQSLAVDPTNPAIVYVGGAFVAGTPSDVLRVDATFLHDAHAFYEDDTGASGGLRRNANDPLALFNFPDSGTVITSPSGLFNAVNDPFINLVRDPKNPFLASASINVIYAGSFTNDGGAASWLPMNFATIDANFTITTQLGGNQHRMYTMVDPTTGKARLIVGTDLGIFSAVDDNGTLISSFGAQSVPLGSRNGNLQVTEFNYGAVQPSSVAALVAGALFYGQANDNNGSPQSAPDVLTTGNLNWSGPLGDGTGVATDQTGSGTSYRFNWPLENFFRNGSVGLNTTDFFVVTPPNSAAGTGIGRTFGLIQDSQPGNVPDPSNWPGLIGSAFAVNPLSKDQAIISSQAGRIFATGNQGVIWVEVGNPTALDSSYAPALAYGSPDPNGPGGSDPTNFFLYAGTVSGKIFVTFNGGGANGNEWLEISGGLDGSPVQTIVTNPVRGSHEAYAVTQQGVYYMADSNFSANNPGTDWVKISSNILTITHTPFGDPLLAQAQAKQLSALVADWRYNIPDDLNNKNGPTHPVLYVSANSGVYRSFDKGVTWKPFPNQNEDQAPADGGYLPDVHVTDLDLGIGNIDPTTGQPTVAGSPDVLLATTYGRGSYAIRVAPTIVPGTLKLLGTVGGQTPLEFSGISEQTAFGNKVRISIYNLTGGQNTYVAGWNGTDNGTGTDNAANWTTSTGAFTMTVPSSAFGPGTRIIGVRLTDDAGVVYTGLLTFPPAVPSIPDLVNASDTGSPPGPPAYTTDNITNDTTPTFTGTADPGVKVTILSDGIAVGTDVADAQGAWIITTTALAAGTRQITATATDIASNVVSNPSSPLAITIDVTPPAAPTTPNLTDASDSGSSNTDNNTNVTTPTFTGTAEAGATVTLFEGATSRGSTVADAVTGDWSITSSALGNGSHSLTARATDVAGNQSIASGALPVTIDVVLPNVPGTPDLLPSSDDGASNTDNVTSINTPTFTGTADPNTAIDLLSDGNVVGTGTSNAAGVWTIPSSALNNGVRQISARARDLAGNTSSPSVALPVTITISIQTPSTPDMTSASDDGASNTDNITTNTTPTFTGTGGPANTTIELLIGGNTVVGSTTSNGAGAWTITVSSALAVNSYNFTARAVVGGSSSAQSAPLAVQIIALAVPSTPDLTAASDDGASNTDNITTDTTPTFTGTGPANATIELLTGGNTVVGSTTSDASGNWTITSNSLSANTYSFTARSKSSGNTSAQSAGLSVTINAPAVATPSTPDLTAITDTGSSNTDNLTNQVRPQFTGTGPANTLIEILIGGNTIVGSGTSNGAGQWTITINAPGLSEGIYSFTARANASGQLSSQSGALQVTIDTTAPAASGVPDLTAASDTGASNTDNNTTDNTPTFTGTGPANTLIDLLANNTVFGSTTSDAQGNWTITSSALPNGTYLFTSRTRDIAGNTSALSAGLQVTITNSPPPPPPLSILSLTLVNADTGKDLFDLTEGMTLDLSTLPKNFAVRANPSPTNVASVKFGFDVTPGLFVSTYRIESLLPYALFADSNNGTKYNAGSFQIGSHTVVATPYAGKTATGTVGTAYTLHFNVTNGLPTQQPTVESFSLINAATDQVIQTINNGSTLNLSQLPSQLAIRANVTGLPIGSVKFGWDATPGQFNANFRTESGAPYTLFGDGNGGADYFAGTIAKGTHTLKGQVFSGSGASGTALGSLQISFTVTDSGTVTPTVTSFSLINASTDQVIKTLVEGETLNLASLPSQLAIRANTSGSVGSVKFGWDPTPGQFNANFHTESTGPYTLFGDGSNGTDYFAGTIAKGSHTLVGAVYSGSGGGGTKQGELTLHFTAT